MRQDWSNKGGFESINKKLTFCVRIEVIKEQDFVRIFRNIQTDEHYIFPYDLNLDANSHFCSLTYTFPYYFNLDAKCHFFTDWLISSLDIFRCFVSKKDDCFFCEELVGICCWQLRIFSKLVKLFSSCLHYCLFLWSCG